MELHGEKPITIPCKETLVLASESTLIDKRLQFEFQYTMFLIHTPIFLRLLF